MSELDRSWDGMGSRLRLVVGTADSQEPAAEIADDVQRFTTEFEAVLSRFRHDSELRALNDDPRGEVPASPLLRQAVAAGLAAARISEGLVDPTLVTEIEAAGYPTSRVGLEPAPLAEALTQAPKRRPARPDPGMRWRGFALDAERGTIRRPPGLRFDTGGAGKGLAADLIATRLAGQRRFAIDCGGDMRIGGRDAAVQPFEIDVVHPLGGDRAHVLRLGSGAVATSGLQKRVWRSEEGFSHHLLDPSTGKPAWTGLISATALAPTALEAEALAKWALLSGPGAAPAILARHGGLFVHDSGRVELAGPLRARPRIRASVAT